MIACIKSGSQSFVLEISRWMMLHSHRPVEVDSDQIKNNQRYTTWGELMLRISKSMKLLVKMKNLSLQEELNRYFDQPNI